MAAAQRVNDGEEIDLSDMEFCVRAVEGILKYNFRNPKHLEHALTHPSYAEPTSYERLEFLGDAVLGLAVANFIFITYTTLDPGQLSLLRSSNVSTEKLARVAVRHRFYRYVRHNSKILIARVHEFVLAVTEEDETVVYGVVRAPKVLADLVEAIAGAVYIDCGFDLKTLWMVFRGLLEPIITLETLREHERPVTALNELCWKQGKRVQIKGWKEDSGHFTSSIYVAGQLVASATSVQKENAKLSAAREALRSLEQTNVSGGGTSDFRLTADEGNEVIAAKPKLSDICFNQKWPEPNYRLEKEEGQSTAKKYVCSVRVEVEEAVLVMHGDEQSSVEDAENSAASFMISSLLAHGHVQRRRKKKRKKTSFSYKGNDEYVDDEMQVD